ncbi:hypothetical protein ACS0PU_005107 [Formica fusca]
MEELILAQHELCSRIARTYNNLKKAGQAKINKGLVATTLKLLDAKWTKFEEQHELLFTEYGAEVRNHEYGTKDFLGQVEEVYVIQRAAVLELEEALAQPASPKTGSRLSGDELRAASRTTLPRIQLPSFSGRYEDWPAFRDLFQSIIGKDSSIAQVEKMHYLKTCLKGEAELLIRNISTTGDHYESAWEMLQSYYENKRLLVRAYLSNFLALQRMKSESPGDLRNIFHCLKSTVSSLENIGRPIDCSEDLFVYLAVELLDPRSRREWESFISDTKEPPSFDTLELFLDRRLHTLEAMHPIRADGAASKQENSSPRSTRSHLARKQENASEVQRSRCALCHQDHFVMLCEEYRRKTGPERKQLIEAKQLCLNCLGRHQVDECASKKTCSVCDARHHSSLHEAYRENAVATSSHVAQGPGERAASVLLATARVLVADRYGVDHNARALVDQGSESTMISERLAQKLRLPRSPISVSVFGVGGQKSSTAKSRVTLSLSPRTGGAATSVNALVLPRLTVYAGGVDPGARTWPHVEGLELADPEYRASDPVDILLGADVQAAIIRQGLRKGGRREPVAQRTTLGWILSGAIDEAPLAERAHIHQCRIVEDRAEIVPRFRKRRARAAERNTYERNFFQKTAEYPPRSERIRPLLLCTTADPLARRVRHHSTHRRSWSSPDLAWKRAADVWSHPPGVLDPERSRGRQELQPAPFDVSAMAGGIPTVSLGGLGAASGDTSSAVIPYRCRILWTDRAARSQEARITSDASRPDHRHLSPQPRRSRPTPYFTRPLPRHSSALHASSEESFTEAATTRSSREQHPQKFSRDVRVSCKARPRCRQKPLARDEHGHPGVVRIVAVRTDTGCDPRKKLISSPVSAAPEDDG